MLRTAKDCLRIREEKLNIFNRSQEEIKGQMKLIESKVMNANIGHRTKYIDIGNVGKIFSENEKQIIKDGYYITQDKNGTRLYFDEKDYNDYINSNGNKKSNLKKDAAEQVKEDKKVETNKNNTDDNFKLKFSSFDGKDNYGKEYNSFEEFKKDLESILEFFKI